MRRVVAGVAGLAGVALVLTACTGVPTSSSPQVIGPGLGGATATPQPTDTPQPGAEPRAIVQEFLKANVSEPLDPRGLREFLTPDEQRKWSDRTVTILQGSVEDAFVGTEGPGDPHAVAVTVTGNQIGSLAADGTYTSSPPGSGGSGQPWTYQYQLDPVNGQSRISDAYPGLVVYADEFAQVYRPVRLYFLDLSEKRLVPDVRYTALQSPQQIASWELKQLIDGPRSELQDAVRTEIPPQPSTRPSVVISGLHAEVELPGSSGFDTDVKQKVAAQLLATLGNDQPQLSLTITDGGVPISIGPNVPQSFTRHDISAIAAPTSGSQPHFFDANPDPQLFYIDGEHRLVTGDGKLVPGAVGSGAGYDLAAVAVTAVPEDSNYYVAADVGTGRGQTFWLGQASGLRKVSGVPPGQLTRPSWLAGQKEAWVAEGASLYRVDANSLAAQQVLTTLPPGSSIVALRLSPEGSRIAMVVHSANGQSQLWVGSIVRTGGIGSGNTARIDSAEPVTPGINHLTDVAWSDDITLWAIGTGPDRTHGIWSVAVDGSGLREHSLSGLPQPQAVDSITAAPGTLPWLSAGGFVYLQTTEWEGPNHRTTRGTNPVYQEAFVD